MFVHLPLLALLLISCSKQEMSKLTNNSLIPAPGEVIASGDYFELNEKTKVRIINENKSLRRTAEFFITDIKEATGLEIEILQGKKLRRTNIIEFILDETVSSEEEGYSISIQKSVYIRMKVYVTIL